MSTHFDGQLNFAFLLHLTLWIFTGQWGSVGVIRLTWNIQESYGTFSTYLLTNRLTDYLPLRLISPKELSRTTFYYYKYCRREGTSSSRACNPSP